jgi:hypothetical protein
MKVKVVHMVTGNQISDTCYVFPAEPLPNDEIEIGGRRYRVVRKVFSDVVISRPSGTYRFNDETSMYVKVLEI